MTSLEQIRRGFSPESIADALDSPFRAVRASAADVLSERLIDVDYQAAVMQLIERGQPSGRVLYALSLVPEVDRLPIAPQVARCLTSSTDSSVRKSAARLLARCFPETCADQVAAFEHFDVRFEFCLSQHDATAVALFRWYLDQGRQPDPGFGLLLTPEWIATHFDEFGEDIERLAFQAGYTDGQPVSDAMALLHSGFWCVPQGLSSADQVPLASRSAEFERMMNQLLTSHRAPDAIPLDLDCPIDFAALCGAARAIDHELLRRRRFENTLRQREDETVRTALCKHATMSYCRRILASDGIQAARELSIPHELTGKFLVERACTMLVHHADHRAERTLHLKTRWHPGTRKSLGSMGDWKFPVECDADDPQLKLTVLPATTFAAARRFVEAPSPGARAASNLMHAAGCPELIPILFELEERYSGFLIPLGIEIQTPFSRDREQESLGWKQALRALGIPSPRRPEYRSMVEASAPPARTFLPPMVLPLLLERIGFFTEPTDLALHMSFSGTLDSRVHLLLLAQMFINEPRVRPRRSTQIARLMSKGFLHLNSDALPLDGVVHGGLRTELRSFRMAVENGPTGPKLRTSCLDDLSSVSLLVAAMRHPSVEARALWERFCDQVEGELDELSPGFRELREMNWWDATGEPRDEDFARELPVVRQYLSMQEWSAQSGRLEELRVRFRAVRRSFAERAAGLIGIDLVEIQERVLNPLVAV